MSLSSDRRAGRKSVLSNRNGQPCRYAPFGQASQSVSSSSSNFWSIFCFMPSRLGFLRVVLPPKVGADDVPAVALWTVQHETEILVLALVSAFAAEESSCTNFHGQKIGADIQARASVEGPRSPTPKHKARSRARLGASSQRGFGIGKFAVFDGNVTAQRKIDS